ncbi:MAG: YbbR-like domain-containing protein [Tannerellaceae bacterium]|jgi:hypothetical protein|nr:YbbR-like domain-containing protein [Tannerellaceae bacterium]
MMRLDTLSQLFRPAGRKVRLLLHRFRWGEALTFLFFLFLSSVFWALQSMQTEYEIQLKIPINYKDMPSDMAFSGVPPQTITARIRDRGSVLLNYTLGNKTASIALSMSDGPAAGGDTLLLSAKDIEAIILKQLIPTTALLSFDPQRIEAPYGRLERRQLPVVFDGDVRTAPGFLVSGDIRVSPQVADVYAAGGVTASLTAARTVYTELVRVDKTVVQRVKLQAVDGATFDPPVVTVTIPVEEYTQKTLDIAVVCKGVPEGYTIRMFPPTVKVTCSTPLSLFRDLSDKDFAVEAVFDAGRNATGTLPVSLVRKPSWVGPAGLSHDSIEFILEQAR